MFRHPSADLEDEVLILLALCEDEERSRIWAHDINLARKQEGEFTTLYPKLRRDEKRFYQYFRMCTTCFDYILKSIESHIHKHHSNWREPISSKERLAVTLRYLATGDSYATIGDSYRMGFSTVGVIVEEVCQAIWKHLQPIHMPEPTQQDWNLSVQGFQEKWNFPNCLGSIDGKHVIIKCPDKTGSNYFSYLKIFSFVLLAIVGPDYKFICIDVGGYGKNSDGGIFEESIMGQKFANDGFYLPPPKPLPNQTNLTPCELIGDQAFALSRYLMRPYPENRARRDGRKYAFNSNLGRARRVVENAFGILAAKWRVFHRPMETKTETSISVVKAACVLHNFLRDKELEHAIFPEEDSTGHAFEELPPNARRSTNYAFEIRDKFADYFMRRNN